MFFVFFNTAFHTAVWALNGIEYNAGMSAALLGCVSCKYIFQVYVGRYGCAYVHQPRAVLVGCVGIVSVYVRVRERRRGDGREEKGETAHEMPVSIIIVDKPTED